MKIKTIILLAGMALFCGCRRPHLNLIPEISLPLIQEEVAAWTGRLAGDIIFPCAGGIGWVDAAGRIMACDIEKKTVATIYTVPFAVTVPPFIQGDFLVLQDGAADRLLIYDLATRAVTFEALHLGATHVLGVDADCLVYLEGEHLTVNFWRRPGVVFRTPGGAAQFFNCQFTPERVLVLTPELLHTFWKKSGRFEAEHLPQPAISPFCLDGENIYYGSSERCLVKYSSKKKRLAWKVKLGQILFRQPFPFAGSIMASPSDHNVLQVNRRGSLLWWQALQSTMNFDLQPMNEHLAAVLLNHEVKFIDPQHQQVISFTSVGNPVSRPLAFNHDLFFLVHDAGTYRLQRIGNRYGIDIELEGGRIGWVGRSVHISLQPCNLLQASLDCEILDASGQQVFSKSAKAAKKVVADWVPLQSGKYTIRVHASAANRNAANEMPMQVVDQQQLVPRFYLHF